MALVVSVGYSTPTTAKGTERKQKLGLNRADHRSPENQSFLILRNPFPLRLPHPIDLSIGVFRCSNYSPCALFFPRPTDLPVYSCFPAFSRFRTRVNELIFYS